MKRSALLFALLLLLKFSLFAAQPKMSDRVVILKSDHRLILYSGDVVIKTYGIAIGRGGLMPKEREGDRRTPEGRYRIDRRKKNSRFHRALHNSYPNEVDRKRAEKLEVNPGGDIMIHGIRNGLGWLGSLHRTFDWTSGCVAVTDSEIEEIWNLVPDGTPVEIRP